jgi:DNA phosphorothioation-dependent restriction protein DptH
LKPNSTRNSRQPFQFRLDASAFLSQDLEPHTNNIRENLVAFLRTRNVADTQSWLKEILADQEICSKLNFAKWKFKDSPDEGYVEVHLDPLRDSKSGAIADGFRDEAGNLIANTTTPVRLKWKTYPANAPNLGHFVLLIVRDNDDEAGTELLRKTIKNNKRTETRARIGLKDIELAEGETCAAKIIVQARDRSGVILSSDECEPFWIEGSDQGEGDTGKKKVNKIRNRAEAFFMSGHRSRKMMEVDSEGWEEGKRPLFYRLKLKNRDIYHILINPVLHAAQLRNITDPATGGAWEANLWNRGAIEAADLQSVPVTVSGLSKYEAFIESRQALFTKFQERDPNGVVEVFDLRQFKMEITTYAEAYIAVLDEVCAKLKAATSDGQINNILNSSHKLSRLDTIHLKIGDSADSDELVLLAPTHPIKMLWILQFQQLLYGWAEQLDGVSEAEAAAMVSREAHEKIVSLNIPSAIAFRNDEIYVNSDNLDLYWSIFPRGTTTDVRKAVSTLQRLLGFKLNQGEITVITAPQIADRIWRYLKHHPYVSTLRVNVINPGDGLLVLNAIREIQRIEEFCDLNYDIAFYADQRYEIMGSAFDEMTEGATLADGSPPDVDEELLQPNKNPLFPKLTFSKHKITESD